MTLSGGYIVRLSVLGRRYPPLTSLTPELPEPERADSVLISHRADPTCAK